METAATPKILFDMFLGCEEPGQERLKEPGRGVEPGQKGSRNRARGHSPRNRGGTETRVESLVQWNDPGATPIIIISSLLGRLLNVTSDMLWLSRARAQVKQKVSHVTVSGFGRLGYTSEGFLKAGRTESKRCHM